MKSAASPEETRCSAHARMPWHPRKRKAPATSAVRHCARGSGCFQRCPATHSQANSSAAPPRQRSPIVSSGGMSATA